MFRTVRRKGMLVKKRILEKTHVEGPVVKWCKDRGIMNRKMNGAGFRSWEDRMFMIPNGKPFFIEFKKPGNPLSALQLKHQQEMRALGYDTESYDDPNEAIQAIADRLEAARLSIKGSPVHLKKLRRGAAA